LNDVERCPAIDLFPNYYLAEIVTLRTTSIQQSKWHHFEEGWKLLLESKILLVIECHFGDGIERSWHFTARESMTEFFVVFKRLFSTNAILFSDVHLRSTIKINSCREIKIGCKMEGRLLRATFLRKSLST
jgi:hypothetical protein